MDLLSPIPVAVTVDFSTRCNLRCTYCSTGSASHVDIDMPQAVLEDIAAFCRGNDVRNVWLSATGETTMSPGWQKALAIFLDDYRQYVLHLNSNFARPFDDDDLEALNKFVHVQVSIDSSRPELMKKQRTADLRNIIYNIIRFRQKQLENNRETTLELSCVLTRDNAAHVEGLASLALLLGVRKVQFIEASTESSGGNPNMPEKLEMMTEEEAVAFAVSVYKGMSLLAGSPTRMQLGGGLLAKLQPALNALHSGRQPVDVMQNLRTNTRESTVGPCTQPWDTVMVHADGNVKACCGSDISFGNAKDRPLAEIFDGSTAREFRKKLLAGGPDLPCHTCPIATSYSVAKFQAELREHHLEYAATGAVYQRAASASRRTAAVPLPG